MRFTEEGIGKLDYACMYKSNMTNLAKACASLELAVTKNLLKLSSNRTFAAYSFRFEIGTRY
jgi:hypothetical protein